MGLLDRFILSIYTFCLAVISLVVILIGLNVVPYSFINTYTDAIFNNNEYVTVTIIIAAVFFFVSLRFLLSGTSVKDKAKNAIEKTSQLGKIKISLNSIQSVIMSAIKQMDGVMDIKITVKHKGDKVEINLNVIVTPERSIPELAAIIQSRTKEVVEKIAGVEVAHTEVMVEDVVQTITPRVKG